MRHDWGVLAGTQRRRRSEPGTDLQLLVLAATADGCIAVDTESGALVRASYALPEGIELELQPACFDLVTAAIAPRDDPDLEPTLPEAVELAGPPHRIGRVSRRKYERLQRTMVHPQRQQLTGIH